MRTHGILLTALIGAALLSGCMGPEATPQEPPAVEPETDEDRTELPWALSTCRVVVALIPVDAESVEAHLPDGFQAVSGEDAFGLPPDKRGDGVIGLETFACESGEGLNQTVDGLAYGAYFTAVEPPAEYEIPDAELPLYKWDTLIPDEARRTLLQERGIPAVDGDTDLSGLTATPGGHAFDVTLTLGEHEHRFTGVTNRPAEAFRQGFYFVEYTETPEGMAAWHMPDNEAPDALEGTGTMELAPGSLPAQIVGATSTQAFFASATTVQFRDGTLELP